MTGTAPDLAYTPFADFFGEDEFVFKVNDGQGDSNLAKVTLTVRPVNDPPVALPQGMTTAEDTPLPVTLSASDVDGDTLTYAIVSGPAHGTLSGTGATLTYTPWQDYNGPDSFAYKANDGGIDSNIAEVTIAVTPVNDAPVAKDQAVTTAEDTQLPISLSATDVDGDSLAYVIVTPPAHGKVTGLAPNLTYTPDANFYGADSLRFKGNDGLIDSNLAMVTITVSQVNDVPVVVGAASATIMEGSAFTGTGSFADPDTDTWTATVNYGDNTGTVPLAVKADQTFQLSHIYADNGTFSIAITVSDSASSGGVATTQVTVVNAGPLLAIEPPAPVVEGSSLAVKGSFSDAGILDTHTAVWNWGDGTSSTGTISAASGAGTITGSHTYADNGSYTVTLTVTDKDGGTGSTTATAVVTNLAPVAGNITAPLDPVPVATLITTSVTFTDGGIRDTHTAVWDWGDGTTSTGTVVESNGSGTVAGSHTYATPGVYSASITIADNDGRTGTALFQYLVVYDPNGGFVTGGGWVASPEGAYVADPAMSGKATFGFVSKYQKGTTVPTGETQFVFKAAALDFQSASYEWLVIAGAKAQFKGVGTINSSGSYGFILTAVDGALVGGGGPDRFRIKIWDKETGKLVYDNQLDTPDNTDPNTAVGGGSIVIHK